MLELSVGEVTEDSFMIFYFSCECKLRKLCYMCCVLKKKNLSG